MLINNNCFVYGTLMSPEVVKILIGRVPNMTKTAFLPNFKRHPVKGHVYPGIIESASSASMQQTKEEVNNYVQGILLSGLSEKEIKIFDWFEGDEYKRCVETILIPIKEKNGAQQIMSEEEANVYVWSIGEEHLILDSEWDYEHFRQMHLDSYLKNVVKNCKDEIDQLGDL